MKTLRIVTRKSKLALWQANFVKQKLQILYPDVMISLIGISTEGDNIIDTPLTKIGGKGLFVKELETMLLNHEADIAVHSMKDVPSLLPEGLTLGAVLERIDPRDALISRELKVLADLRIGAVVGTSSLRREAQLLHLRPDLKVKALRGNVDTRLLKLDKGEFDAIILAVAGLKRLGCSEGIAEIFTPTQMLPSIGQGALGIECRLEDIQMQTLIAPLHHLETWHCLTAERSLNQALGGSCQSPIAGYARITEDENQLMLEGRVMEPNGTRILCSTKTIAFMQAFDLGKQVAAELIAQGAGDIIAACHHGH